MSSAAGLPGRKRPGRWRMRACPSCCTKCGRCVKTDAHQTEKFAELVCSNSFRSDDWRGNAVGLLHEEMRRLGSLVMASADRRRCRRAARSRWTAMCSRDAVTAALRRIR